jgi:hypothetical protein
MHSVPGAFTPSPCIGTPRLSPLLERSFSLQGALHIAILILDQINVIGWFLKEKKEGKTVNKRPEGPLLQT